MPFLQQFHQCYLLLKVEVLCDIPGKQKVRVEEIEDCLLNLVVEGVDDQGFSVLTSRPRPSSGLVEMKRVAAVPK